MWGRFDDWRSHQGFNKLNKMKGIPLKEFGKLMMIFLVMLCKLNGDKYSTSSIMNMYMTFNFTFIEAHHAKMFDTNTIMFLPFQHT
jgi:hypothetical protein